MKKVDYLALEDSVSREDFLKATIAAGILANPNIDPKSWGLFEKADITEQVKLSWLKRSVNRAYEALFE